MQQFSLCVLIPYYNHGEALPRVIEKLSTTGHPVILIDDGSTAYHSSVAEELKTRFNFLTIIKHQTNCGKGAALRTGLLAAWEQGYTHALQIDADDQHDQNDIPEMITEAINQPESLILAYPVFGPEAPWERVWGRKLTTAMISLQTFSIQAKDGLFGFRIYPLAGIIPILNSHRMAGRMSFDPEIVVRCLLAKIPIINFPSRVCYHPGGVSHFHYISDNYEMIRMHTLLILEKFCFWKKSSVGNSWHNVREKGSRRWLTALFTLGLLTGKNAAKTAVIPFIWFVTFTDSRTRMASLDYLRRARIPFTPSYREVYRHLKTFSDALIESVFAWHEVKTRVPERAPELTSFRRRLLDGKGGVILSAHFGALEYARARFSQTKDLKIIPVMYLRNSKNFREFLNSVNNQSSEDVILVEEFTPATVIMLRQRLKEGAYIALLADRLPPTTSDRSVTAPFLEEQVSLPWGPFFLSDLLEADTISLFCYFDEQSKLVLKWKDLEKLPGKSNREMRIAYLAKQFASQLAEACKIAPYQWFNFYDFFQKRHPSDQMSLKQIRLTPPAPSEEVLSGQVLSERIK